MLGYAGKNKSYCPTFVEVWWHSIHRRIFWRRLMDVWPFSCLCLNPQRVRWSVNTSSLWLCLKYSLILGLTKIFNVWRTCRFPNPYGGIPFSPIKLSISLFLAEFLLYSTRYEQTNQPLLDFVAQSLMWLDVSQGEIANSIWYFWWSWPCSSVFSPTCRIGRRIASLT